jgi:hypothetical protein
MHSYTNRRAFASLISVILWVAILCALGALADSNRSMAVLIDPWLRQVVKIEGDISYAPEPLQDSLAIFGFLIAGIASSAVLIERAIYCAKEMRALKPIRAELERSMRIGVGLNEPETPIRSNAEAATISGVTLKVLAGGRSKTFESFQRVVLAQQRAKLAANPR